MKLYKILLIFIFIFCVGLTLYLLFYNLGKYPFENWDEAFYAQGIKEMLHNHDLFVLHWDYKIWLDKPPLFIWMGSISSLVLGFTEFAVRLPSAVSALLIVGLSSFYVYKKYRLIPALFTFFTLILNNVFVWRSRSGNIDLLVSLFILVTFFIIQSKDKRRYILLGFTFAAIFLTKGPLVAFPFTIFLLHEVLFQRKKWRKNIKEYIKLLVIFVGISGIWLFLGSLEVGLKFTNFYLFQSDEGVATLSKLNTHYLEHVYYSLQRRFFWVFLLGSIIAIWKIRKSEYFLLVMYSLFLLLQLSFTSRDNNWYLIPSMPFWSIAIGFGIYSILKLLNRNKLALISLGTIICCVSGYIFYRTLTINILPILSSSSVVEQAQSAIMIEKLSKPTDVVVRLDPLIPTTLYYDNRYTLASTPNAATQSYWISPKDLAHAIKNNKVQFIVGTNEDLDNFFKSFDSKIFEKVDVNSSEIILKVKNN